jgi:hypothetical protein
MKQFYICCFTLVSMGIFTGCAPTHPTATTAIMPQAQVMEVLTYRTQLMVSDSKHIAHASAYAALLSQLDGYIGQQLAQGENGSWIYIAYWRDNASAEKARDLVQSMNRPELHDFFADMKDKDGKLMRAEIILH